MKPDITKKTYTPNCPNENMFVKILFPNKPNPPICTKQTNNAAIPLKASIVTIWLTLFAGGVSTGGFLS